MKDHEDLILTLENRVNSIQSQSMTLSNNGLEFKLHIPDAVDVKETFSLLLNTISKQQASILNLEERLNHVVEENAVIQQSYVLELENLKRQHEALRSQNNDNSRAIRFITYNIQGFDEDQPILSQASAMISTVENMMIPSPNNRNRNVSLAFDLADRSTWSKDSKRKFYRSIPLNKMPTNPKRRFIWAAKKILFLIRRRKLHIGISTSKASQDLSVLRRLELLEDERLLGPLSLKTTLHDEIQKVIQSQNSLSDFSRRALELNKQEILNLLHYLEDRLKNSEDYAKKSMDAILGLQNQVQSLADASGHTIESMVPLTPIPDTVQSSPVESPLAAALVPPPSLLPGWTRKIDHLSDKIKLITSKIKALEPCKARIQKYCTEESSSLALVLNSDLELQDVLVEVSAVRILAQTVTEDIQVLKEDMETSVSNADDVSQGLSLLGTVNDNMTLLDQEISLSEQQLREFKKLLVVRLERILGGSEISQELTLLLSRLSRVENDVVQLRSQPSPPVMLPIAAAPMKDDADAAANDNSYLETLQLNLKMAMDHWQQRWEIMDGNWQRLKEDSEEEKRRRRDWEKDRAEEGFSSSQMREIVEQIHPVLKSELDEQWNNLVTQLNKLEIENERERQSREEEIKRRDETMSSMAALTPDINAHIEEIVKNLIDMHFATVHQESKKQVEMVCDSSSFEVTDPVEPKIARVGSRIRMKEGQYSNRDGVVVDLIPSNPPSNAPSNPPTSRGKERDKDSKDGYKEDFGSVQIGKDAKNDPPLSIEAQFKILLDNEEASMNRKLDKRIKELSSGPVQEVAEKLREEMQMLSKKLEQLKHAQVSEEKMESMLMMKADSIDVERKADGHVVEALDSTIRDLMNQIGDVREIQTKELKSLRKQLQQSLTSAITKALEGKPREESDLAVATSKAICLGCGRETTIRTDVIHRSHSPGMSHHLHPQSSVPPVEVVRSGFRMGGSSPPKQFSPDGRSKSASNGDEPNGRLILHDSIASDMTDSYQPHHESPIYIPADHVRPPRSMSATHPSSSIELDKLRPIFRKGFPGKKSNRAEAMFAHQRFELSQYEVEKSLSSLMTISSNSYQQLPAPTALRPNPLR